MSARAAVACLVALLVVLAASAGVAQVPRLDPAPWYAVADSASRGGVVLGLDRFWDDPTGWNVGRLGLTVTAPFGSRSLYFLRAHVVRFDTAGLPVLTRWPALRGADAADDWPGSTSPTGIARPEVGLIVPVGLPGVGAIEAALAMGLPIGPDALYPFSARSWPLRLECRRAWHLDPAWWCALHLGAETTFDSSGDDLNTDAFPAGWRYALEMAWEPRPWRQVVAGYEERRLGEHASRRATLGTWIPAAEGCAVGLMVARELGPRADRAATNEVSVLWRFAGLPAAKAGESR